MISSFILSHILDASNSIFRNHSTLKPSIVEESYFVNWCQHVCNSTSKNMSRGWIAKNPKKSHSCMVFQVVCIFCIVPRSVSVCLLP